MMEKRETSGGWGENGIFIHSRAAYHRQVNVGELSGIVLPVCKKYGVTAPTFEIRQHRLRQWGTYYPSKNMIAFNIPMKLGNIYHELAHHIAKVKYHSRGHDWWFKRVLGEILDEAGI